MGRAVFLNDGAGLFEPVRQYLQSKGYQVDRWELEDTRPLPVDEQTLVFLCAADGKGVPPTLGAEPRLKAVLSNPGVTVSPSLSADWRVLRTPLALHDIDALLASHSPGSLQPAVPAADAMPRRVSARSVTPPPSDISNSARWSGTLLSQLAALQHDALSSGRAPVQICEALAAFLHGRFSPALAMIAYLTTDSPGALGSAVSRHGAFEFSKVLLPGGAGTLLPDGARETLVQFFHASASADNCSGQGFYSLWNDGPIFGIIGVYDAGGGNSDELDYILQFLGQIAAAGISRADALGRATDLIYRDELTGLYNRRFFMMILEREMARAQRTGAALSVVMLDTDNLKEINDRLGHPEGDRLLQAVAASLGECVRQSDCAARIGGDEFGIVLADSSAAESEQTVQRVLARFRARGIKAGLPYGFCHGIAEASPAQATVQALVARADQALIAMKQTTKSGRHRAVTGLPSGQANR
jgi:diguanylate cyclase (GGDEF)-like protein